MFSPADAREPLSAPSTGRPDHTGAPGPANHRTGPHDAGRTPGSPAAPRTARRLPALLLAAAVLPVALTACSSGAAKPSAAPSASATKPAAPKVRYAALPSPCGALSTGTVKSLVPGARSTKGTAATAGTSKDRGGCSWNGLSGYQYRYLDTSFQRYDNVTGGTSGNDEAAAAYSAAVRATQAGATDAQGKPTTSSLRGVGDQASLVSWTTSKDHATYVNVTVVTSSANVVLTVDYIGAGLQGDHRPKSSDLDSGAQKAAREALAALG